MIKILYVTGTRAEYGVMYQILKLIDKNPLFDLMLIVTGMHISKLYGNTIDDIRKDGFKIVSVVDMGIEDDMADSFGKCYCGVSQALKDNNPDIILLEGDRGEMLAAAIASAHLNIPVVHISGGDVSGSIDNSIRKAITCFAHIHLVNTDLSMNRLLKAGEKSWRVKMVGSLGLDMNFEKLESSSKIASEFDVDLSKPLLLVLQHPVTGEMLESRDQMKSTLDSIVSLKHQTILIYPNSDAGNARMIDVIEKYRKYSFIKIYKTLPRRKFLSILSITNVMIGNSSAGLVEAPIFNVPVINIGTRQVGRERASNIFDVSYDSSKIIQKINEVLFYSKTKKFITPYENRNTAHLIVKELTNLEINKKLLNKYGD